MKKRNGDGGSVDQIDKRTRQLINKFRDSRDVNSLSKLSYDENYVISKYYIIHELVKIGKPAVNHLKEMCLDKNHLVRELTLKTLCEIGDKAIVPDIMRALTDEKRRVRIVALSALKKLTEMSFGSYARRNESHENQEQVIRKWLNWWEENNDSFMSNMKETLVEV